MAIISIFGRVADLRVPLAEKRKRGLEELCRFFQARDWMMEQTGETNGHLKAGGHCLAAGRNGRQLVIRRDADAAPFGRREQELFELVATRIPWLLEPESIARMEEVRLSPKMQRVLVLICLGRSRKEIAEDLHVKPGTIDGYVRDLYQIHGVRSQTALIRFYAGSERLRLGKKAS